MSVQLYWKRVIFSEETQVVVCHDRRVHTMFVKSLKVSLLLTFTERKITRSPGSVTNFFLPVLGLFSTEFLSS
jgi:hypothetical protein